jgi:hypothetical protein
LIFKGLQRGQRENPSNPLSVIFQIPCRQWKDADLPSSQCLGALENGATIDGARQTTDISANQRQWRRINGSWP